MEKLLMLMEQSKLLQEDRAYIEYVEDHLCKDMECELARAKFAYGEKAYKFLTDSGKGYKEFINELTDVNVGILVQLLAKSVNELRRDK